jgi:glycosyltransferase involved in cell wall biosynthesis
MLKKRSIIIYLTLALAIIGSGMYLSRQPDITVIGPIKEGDGLGRNTIDFIKVLSQKYNINCLPTQLYKKELSIEAKKAIKNPIKRLGKVVLFTEPLWTPDNQHSKIFKKLAKSKNSIKVAYSMFESSLIPPEWADILNGYFDLVAVPDEYLVDVYRNSGVTIPVKVLPLCVDFSDLKTLNLKKEKKDIFVYTILSSSLYRKNILASVKAFARLFANNENVYLRINSRYSLDDTNKKIKSFIKKSLIKNIIFSESCLSRKQYNSLLKFTDCLINVSMGEGFSIQPREAMMLGIPCIVSK